MTDDPYVVLGVDPGASLDDLAAARRRLARAAHPDAGGSDGAMQRLNAAYDEAVRRAGEVRPAPEPPASRPAGPDRPSGRRRGGRVQVDHPSFTLDVLPVEAYEALLVVTSWMGEVLVDEPPYLLEVFLHDPSPCWCRLDLVPDAGGTTVSLVVAGVDGSPAPDAEDVRDEWVANLNRL